MLFIYYPRMKNEVVDWYQRRDLPQVHRTGTAGRGPGLTFVS